MCMIFTWIKHQIYEIAIDIAFRGVFVGFQQASLGATMPDGDYQHIRVKVRDRTVDLYNVNITCINPFGFGFLPTIYRMEGGTLLGDTTAFIQHPDIEFAKY